MDFEHTLAFLARRCVRWGKALLWSGGWSGFSILYVSGNPLTWKRTSDTMSVEKHEQWAKVLWNTPVWNTLSLFTSWNTPVWNILSLYRSWNIPVWNFITLYVLKHSGLKYVITLYVLEHSGLKYVIALYVLKHSGLKCYHFIGLETFRFEMLSLYTSTQEMTKGNAVGVSRQRVGRTGVWIPVIIAGFLTPETSRPVLEPTHQIGKGVFYSRG